MSKSKKLKINSWAITLGMFALIFLPSIVLGQGTANTLDLKKFEAAANDGIDVMKNIALAVLGLIILVSAGTLIWNLTQGSPQSKGGLMGFFGGIIVFIVVYEFFG
jgi:hypothetical protein